VRFNYFHECQLAGKHEFAILVNGEEVCTCGLIAEGKNKVANTDGHLYVIESMVSPRQVTIFKITFNL
jgi:hypothetical protein